MFLPHPRVKVSIVGSLRDREGACSASDRQRSNFESCVWRTVSSQSSHHPQEVLLAQFSLYVHKGGLKPDSFHFISFLKLLDPKHVLICPVNTKQLYDFMQCWTNVEDVGPTLYKWYTNVLYLLGRRTFSQTLYIYSMLVQCWASVADVGLALIQHWINVPFK